MTLGTAHLTLITVALATYIVAAIAGLWIAPQTLGVSAPEAYVQFEGSSFAAIVMSAMIWNVWTAGSVLVVLSRLRRSDAWMRVGRHRYVSVTGSALMVAGLVASGAWTLWVEVDLAAEHVTMYREAGRLMPIAYVCAAGVCAIAVALVLGAVGAAVDRVAGKAPLIEV